MRGRLSQPIDDRRNRERKDSEKRGGDWGLKSI